MTPAFSSRAHVAGFCLVIAGTLVLPMAIPGVFWVPRSEVYRAVPDKAGPFAHIEQEVLHDSGDIDVVFVGSSLLWAGIDTEIVENALSARIHRPARVVMLGSNWEGADLPYVLLRDVLAHRRTRLVVLSTPTSTLTHDTPHIQAFRWLRYGEYPELTHSLPLRGQVSLYAAEVLGAPRHVVSWLRPNLVYPDELSSDWGRSERSETGYYGAAFVPEPSDARVAPPDTMIYAESGTTPFQFVGPRPGAFEQVILRETGTLLQRYGVAAAAIHVPTVREHGQQVVRERFRWPEALGVPCPILGVPSATLFGGMTDERFYHYYYDDHLNRNGSHLFTATIAPAIVQAYLLATATP